MNKENRKNREIRWLLNDKYEGETSALAEKDIKRMKRGEPVDYVIGFIDFLGCRIDLSLKSFIPEFETEYWAGEAIDDMRRVRSRRYASQLVAKQRLLADKGSFAKHCGPELRVLDIFAGSGCLGIAVLKNIKGSKVDFAEKDDKCLEQVRVNLRINRIKRKRFRLIKSDIFRGIAGKYDFILANPPYIAKARKDKVQKSVLEYEPAIALFGGKDGLRYIRKFLRDARNHLNGNGRIYMEFDSFQKKELAELLKNLGYENFTFEKDQYGRWRYLIANPAPLTRRGVVFIKEME